MILAGDTVFEPLHHAATDIFTDSLAATRIDTAFDLRLRFTGDKLERLIPDGSGPETINLADYKRIFVIALGKAAAPMLDVLLDRMKRRKGLRGVCISKHLPALRNWRIRYFEAGHPLPNEDSLAGARATLALLRKARQDTLIFFLISGGGSAMMDLPLDPEIGLDDLIAFHQVLLESGAPIQEMNTLRKHFSAVKGGRLAMAAPDAAKISLLLPDVPLRELDALSSGPTTPDPSTVADARAIVAKYGMAAKFPSKINAFFERDDIPESPGSKSRLPAFAENMLAGNKLTASVMRRLTSRTAMKDEVDAFRKSVYEILLSTHDLVENARALARHAGYHVVIDNSVDNWDYAEAARYLLARFHELRAVHKRLCLISSGEVTVTMDRTPGAGGRNMQFALACAMELEKHPEAQLTVLSAGTDGIDGNTNAAGAIADPTTTARARAFGFDPEECLRNFNACPLFTALGDLVVTGPTGHNLRDLRLLISAE